MLVRFLRKDAFRERGGGDMDYGFCKDDSSKVGM